MKTYNIALIKGDGIGPEIIDEAVKVLDAVALDENIAFNYREALMGGCAYDVTGDPLPQETIAFAVASDAVLYGTIGAEHCDALPSDRVHHSGI